MKYHHILWNANVWHLLSIFKYYMIDYLILLFINWNSGYFVKPLSDVFERMILRIINSPKFDSLLKGKDIKIISWWYKLMNSGLKICKTSHQLSNNSYLAKKTWRFRLGLLNNRYPLSNNNRRIQILQIRNDFLSNS